MIHYSVLDLAVVTEGSNPAEAIERSRELAVHTEKWGYTRFWMAEHHNMEHIASSATSILLGHVAEATKTIRVGSGGIMLPNHSPLIIAEQFGTLATMYPDRVDLGLGRAPGTDPVTANAIRNDRMQAVREFPESVRELQVYFSEQNKNSAVRAIPGEGTNVPIWILGSSTDSAWLAAVFGLPYAFASHFAPAQLMPAIEIYRTNFRPSEQLKEPYVMPCVNVIAADTDERAELLATSQKQMFAGIVTDTRKPLAPPVENLDEILSPREKMAVEQMLSTSFIGSPESLERQLDEFLEETKADELMVTGNIYDFQERLKSHQILADVMKRTVQA